MFIALIAALIFQDAGNLPWQSFTSRDRRMSVDFPGRIRASKNQLGRAEIATYERVESGFTVIFSDLPDGAEDLRGAVQIWMQSIEHFRLNALKMAWGKWKGYPSFDVVLFTTEGTPPQLIMRIRFVLSHDRLVQQFASWTKSSYDPTTVDWFFKSLVIK